MSSELERLLRQARRTLPGPSSAATRRARALALSRRKGGLRRRSALALGAALLVAVGIGAGLGALIAPSGTAASGARGVGFLPERGWSVLQNGGDGTPARPAGAIAANVPLHASDDPEGLPYATLQALPPDGIVIVAGFIERGERLSDRRFPRRGLPLKIGNATPFIDWGVQVRPEQPLGQYQLLAAVDGYNVDVNLYFGVEQPSQAHFAAAQRQLDRLVVRRPTATGQVEARTIAGVQAAPSRIVDRTLLCPTVSVFGDRFARISSGSAKTFTTGKFPASASVATGAAGGIAALVGVEDGPGSGRTTGGVWFNSKRCRSARATVALSPRGLPGPPVQWDSLLRCKAGARVLVRVRAVLDRRPNWRTGGQGRELQIASANLSSAALSVRTEAGKPLAFISIQAGKAKQYTAPGCTD